MRVRDELGELFADVEFAGAFSGLGRAAWSPGRLALVTALQHVENLTDRAAAERVRVDLAWKYCLGLELDDPGFDHTLLHDFRARLVAHGLEEKALDLLLAALRGRGLVKERGRERTDSTHVVAAVRRLNRLELCAESVRAALEALASAAPHWVEAVLAGEGWQRRYGRPFDESWRPPSSQAGRDRLAADIGADAVELLQAVYHHDSPGWLRELPAVQVLRQVIVQNYQVTTDGRGRQVVKRREAEQHGLPPGRWRLTSPYDTDARTGGKHGMQWTGYKLHITETCDTPVEPAGKRPARPNLIVNVATTDASVADAAMTLPIHQQLRQRDLLPGEHFQDSGYASAALVKTVHTDYGVVLVTPLTAPTSRQARARAGFDQAAFTIDWNQQQATCPQGQTSHIWSRTTRRSRPVIRVRFPATVCGPCPVREQCTTATRTGRQLNLQPHDLHELTQANRAAQHDKDWQTNYATRAGIEGTIHQAVHVTGARRTRYRGLPKTHLDHAYNATALNLIRLNAWWNHKPLDRRRTTHLTRCNLDLTT
jgi:transposase